MKKVISLMFIALMLASLPACHDEYKERDRQNREQLEELLAAPPPTVHESKAPFAIGGLITPTEYARHWQIEYGDFPVMMCSTSVGDLGNDFAYEFLGLRRQEYPLQPIPYDEKDIVMYKFVSDEHFASNLYDADQQIYFCEEAALNLMLLANFTITDREYLENETGEEITAAEIARDAAVFVVHVNHPVSSLTSAQLKDVLTGKIDDWAAFGGESLPIELYYEAPSSDLIEAIGTHVLNGEDILPTVTVEQMMGRHEVPVRIPYEGQSEGIYMTTLREAKEMDGYKILAIDSVEPTNETVQSGEYPIFVSYFAVYMANDEVGTPGTFVSWMFSQEGSDFVIESGYIPVN